MNRIALLIDPNDGCNLNCRHCGLKCPHLNPVSRQQTMSVADYTVVLDWLRPYLASIALGCIREPLVHPEIKALMRLSDEPESLTGLALSTNGTLWDQEIIDILAGSRQRWQVNLSLESCDPKTYEHIRRGARFEQFEHGLRELSAAAGRSGNIDIAFSAVVMKPNLDEFPRLLTYAARMGVAKLIPMHLNPHDFNQHLVLSDTEEKKAAAMVNDLTKQTPADGVTVDLCLYRPSSDVGVRHPATPPTMIMNPAGHVYPRNSRGSLGSIFDAPARRCIRDHFGLPLEVTE